MRKADFDRAYEEIIINRRFVEYEDYYRSSRKRFWQGIAAIEALGIPSSARVLDIGGGITGALLNRLKRFEVVVGDVNDRARADIEELGLQFRLIDISRDISLDEQFDLIVLQEVIEHIPQPPYVVFNRLRPLMKPGGYLLITTPNGHRFRNLVYLLLGKEILGLYKYPKEGEALGHQHEYTMKQLMWQAKNSNLAIHQVCYYEDGFSGASLKARLAWKIAKPTTLIPYWRNSIMMTLQQPLP